MNAKQLIVALFTVAATGAAFAQAAPATTSESGVTRAQVIAQYKQARADGSLNYADNEYPAMPAFVSTKTRAQVIGELKTAEANGQVAENDTDYPVIPAVKSTLTRQQVIAEFTRARANGEISTDPEGMAFASGAHSEHISTR